jgi:hypothetical protein
MSVRHPGSVVKDLIHQSHLSLVRSCLSAIATNSPIPNPIHSMDMSTKYNNHAFYRHEEFSLNPFAPVQKPLGIGFASL